MAGAAAPKNSKHIPHEVRFLAKYPEKAQEDMQRE